MRSSWVWGSLLIIFLTLVSWASDGLGARCGDLTRRDLVLWVAGLLPPLPPLLDLGCLWVLADLRDLDALGWCAAVLAMVVVGVGGAGWCWSGWSLCVSWYFGE